MGVFMIVVLSTMNSCLAVVANCRAFLASRLCVTLIALQQWRSRANGISPINLLVLAQRRHRLLFARFH